MNDRRLSVIPRWVCVSCGETFSQFPYDIGDGPEVHCYACDWCFLTNGDPGISLSGWLLAAAWLVTEAAATVASHITRVVRRLR